MTTPSARLPRTVPAPIARLLTIDEVAEILNV